MPKPPRDSDDPLDPLLAAAFAARESRVLARGDSVGAQFRVRHGIEATPLVFGAAAPVAG